MASDTHRETTDPEKDQLPVGEYSVNEKSSAQQELNANGSSTEDGSNLPADIPKGELEKAEAEDDAEYPGTWAATVIVMALFLSIFLVALDQTIIGTAIPKITDQFNSVPDIGWYGSAYFLTSTALQPSFGKIYKAFDVSLPGFFVLIADEGLLTFHPDRSNTLT